MDSDVQGAPTWQSLKFLLTRVVLPLGIVGVGALCTGLLLVTQSGVERSDPAPRVIPVEVVEVMLQSVPARVEASGTVQPAASVSLVPEVAGRVVWVSDELIPGGRFAKGAPILRIEARDYELALEMEQSRLAQAELELTVEQQRQGIAEREWELLGDGEARQLTLRKPHLNVAQSSVAAALAGVEQARLRLNRTTLRAPFNAVVTTENVDVGQVVGSGGALASLVGTDKARVRVSVPMDKVEWIAVGAQGSIASVVQRLARGEIQRSGRVSHLVGELDPQTRTAQLMIEVDEPYLQDELPLLPGAYVDVMISGIPLPQVATVPRVALHQGNRVWTVGEDDRIVERTVEVAWREGEVVFAVGLATGERVVVTPLPLAVEGMKVRIENASVAEREG